MPKQISRAIFFTLSFLLLAARHSLFAGGDWGVLVLAHGGDRKWNASVRRTVRAARLAAPTETVFGMAAMPEERDRLVEALLRLKRAGARRILAVPLLVSSHSEVYRQYEYMLGLRDAPGFSEQAMRAMPSLHSGHHRGAPAHAPSPLQPAAARGSDTPVYLTRALDDAPELLAALRDRVRAAGRDPARETVVLVGHGPLGEDDNRVWLETLGTLAVRLALADGYAAGHAVTLRDDAPPAVREAATRELRDLVASLRGNGGVLVAPVLIAAGGIEKGLARRLRGLDCRIAAPLGDHPALAAWIARKARENAGE